jgi:flagellar biosynthesis protein FlhA
MTLADTLMRLPRQMMAGNQGKGLVGPVLIILILAMMVLPLPPFLLDLLFTFNIALSIMVLLVSMYTMKALDFAAFPSVLLFTTLLRLSLNVASTRVVLMEGHTGPDAAGKVIEAFGHFLVGGNFAVGVMVFIILVVINFMVITKGAGRIAEVGARFTLDAMPGKQMAIDADLNAGLIGEDVARQRRAEVAQEADFYGSMDGASKFVRGDAVAGLLILVINIVGGLIVGMAQHGLDFNSGGDHLHAAGHRRRPGRADPGAGDFHGGRCHRLARHHQRGRGRPADRPAVREPAGAVPDGRRDRHDGPDPRHAQPGLPDHRRRPGLAGAAHHAARRGRCAAAKAEAAARRRRPAESQEASWDDVALVDPLGLEVGYRLISLVDKSQNGELLGRIKSIRKKFAQDIGFLVPVVHIRDNLEIKPNAYVLKLKGVQIGHGEAFPGQWMAINPGQVSSSLPGTPTQRPGLRPARHLDRRPACASRRRSTATPWSTPAPWWPRI